MRLTETARHRGSDLYHKCSIGSGGSIGALGHGGQYLQCRDQRSGYRGSQFLGDDLRHEPERDDARMGGQRFLNSVMPFSLDGVSVMLNVQYASSGLCRLCQPDPGEFPDAGQCRGGATTVQVKNPAGTSTAQTITVAAGGQMFTSDGKSVLGAHANGSLVSKAAPAAPGETVTIYCTGLGVTTPDWSREWCRRTRSRWPRFRKSRSAERRRR